MGEEQRKILLRETTQSSFFETVKAMDSHKEIIKYVNEFENQDYKRLFTPAEGAEDFPICILFDSIRKGLKSEDISFYSATARLLMRLASKLDEIIFSKKDESHKGSIIYLFNFLYENELIKKVPLVKDKVDYIVKNGDHHYDFISIFSIYNGFKDLFNEERRRRMEEEFERDKEKEEEERERKKTLL